MDEGSICEDGPTDEVVAKYMMNQGVEVVQYHWQNPESSIGTTELSFISATVRKENGDPGIVFQGKDPIHIEVFYEVNDEIQCFVSVCLTTPQGVPLLTTLDTDKHNVGSKLRPPGKYRSTFVIPGNLLTVGHYNVSLYSHQLKGKDFGINLNVIGFEISFEGSLQDLDRCTRPNSSGIRPYIEWHTELI